jgi:hypothetical protein
VELLNRSVGVDVLHSRIQLHEIGHPWPCLQTVSSCVVKHLRALFLCGETCVDQTDMAKNMHVCSTYLGIERHLGDGVCDSATNLHVNIITII